MSGEPPPLPRGGSALTTAVFAGVLVILGLLVGLPWLLGPVVGGGGVLASAAWRRRSRGRTDVALLPALAALGILLLAATPARSTELFGGMASLAFLLWLADDPGRPAGGGRRAVPLLGVAALAFGLGWGVTLLLPTGVPNVGLAAVLLVGALALVAIALARAVAAPRAETA